MLISTPQPTLNTNTIQINYLTTFKPINLTIFFTHFLAFCYFYLLITKGERLNSIRIYFVASAFSFYFISTLMLTLIQSLISSRKSSSDDQIGSVSIATLRTLPFNSSIDISYIIINDYLMYTVQQLHR